MQDFMACFVYVFYMFPHYSSARGSTLFCISEPLRLATTVSYITTAVPEQVTMSIDPPCPTVS